MRYTDGWVTKEALKQMDLANEYPDVVIGCCGGGSNDSCC